MLKQRRLQRFLAFSVFVFLGIALAPAAASADVEPNDAIWQAEAPATTRTTYVGDLPGGEIADWYAFSVASQQQIHLTWTNYYDHHEANCVDVRLVDSQGSPLNDDHTTDLGVTTIYVRVFAVRQSSCPSYEYTFTLAPTAAFGPGPAALAPVATGEPNESTEQAFGPISGATLYRGTIDTSNDSDFFYFVPAPGTQQVTITAYRGIQPTAYPFDFWDDGSVETPTCGYGSRLSVWRDRNTRELAGSLEAWNSYAFTTPTPGAHLASWTISTEGLRRYYIQETGDTVAPPCNDWLFRVDPPTALMTQPQLECISTEKHVRWLKRSIRADKRRLSRARSKAARRAIKQRIGRKTSALRKARRFLRSCP
jgi:hypothetical protein